MCDGQFLRILPNSEGLIGTEGYRQPFVYFARMAARLAVHCMELQLPFPARLRELGGCCAGVQASGSGALFTVSERKRAPRPATKLTTIAYIQ